MAMTTEIKKQFTFRISQANATEMVVILYDMALQYLKDAEDLADKEFTEYQAALRKAGACVQELLRSLHMEYEPAGALLQLYLYCLRRLSQAEVRRHPEFVEEISGILVSLRNAYDQLSDQNADGPVMQNAQAVYAGLTYGKNTLTENMADQGVNRGVLV